MKTLRAILAAFTLLTLAAVPAFSEDNQQAKEHAGAGGTVTKTFQLTLYGSVPDDMSAVANFFTREQFEAGQHESTTIVLRIASRKNLTLRKSLPHERSYST